VDLIALQHEIRHTFGQFSAFLTSLQQFPTAQQASTATPNPTDDDDNDSVLLNDRRQPVDLLALQREIIQQTASIHTFFASLIPLPTATSSNNNNSDSNGRLHADTPSDDPTTVTNSAHVERLTLHQYLDRLTTAECFIPACILRKLVVTSSQMHWSTHQLAPTTHALMHRRGPTDHQNLQLPTQQHTPMMTNRYQPYQSHSDHKNPGARQHATLSNIKPAPYSLIDGVPMTHLDRPPDQPRPLRTASTEYLAPDSGIPQPATRRIGPMIYRHGLRLCYNPANSCFPGHLRTKYKPAAASAAQHSVAHFVEKHDLRPP